MFSRFRAWVPVVVRVLALGALPASAIPNGVIAANVKDVMGNSLGSLKTGLYEQNAEHAWVKKATKATGPQGNVRFENLSDGSYAVCHVPDPEWQPVNQLLEECYANAGNLSDARSLVHAGSATPIVVAPTRTVR